MRFPIPLRLLAVTLLLLAQVFSPLYADTFSYPDKNPKFKLEVPPNWKVDRVKEDKNEYVTFTSPSGAIKAVLKSVVGDADHGVNVLVADTEVVLKYDVKDSALLGGGFMPIKLNNITSATQLNAKGTGTKDGKPTLLYFLIFSSDRKLWNLLYGIFPDSAPKQEQEQFHKMVGSINAI